MKDETITRLMKEVDDCTTKFLSVKSLLRRKSLNLRAKIEVTHAKDITPRVRTAAEKLLQCTRGLLG